jgi:hypothetical protein
VLECCKHLFTPSKHKRALFHAGYTRTGLPQSEQPGLLRGSACMVRFTREVPIPPPLRATRGHNQRTATAVLRAKTHQRQGPPYRILPPPKAQGWARRRGSDNLIGAAARASSGSVHTLAPNDKRATVPKSKDPDHRWCEVQAGIQRWVADAGPLLSLTLTRCQRNVVKCAQNLS